MQFNSGYKMDTTGGTQGTRKSSKWTTLASAYLVTVLNMGFFLAYGTLFDDVKTALSSTRAETAIVQSTLVAIGIGSGLPVGVLVHKYGPVIVGIGGSVLSSLGLMASFFVTKILHLVICIGLFNGIGFSCVLVSSSTVVGQVFHGKQRLMVLSILNTGAGVGGIIYPFCLRFLSDTYGFRGALLIMGSIILNNVPLCTIWRNIHSQHHDQHSDRTNQHGRAMTASANNDKHDLTVGTVLDNNKQRATERSGQRNTGKLHDAVQCESSNDHGQQGTGRTTQGNVFNNTEVGPEDRQTQPYNSTDPQLRYYRKRVNSASGKTIMREVVDTRDIEQMASTKNLHSARHIILQILKNKRFVIFTVGSFLTNPCFIITLAFVVDIFLDKGFTEDDASLGLTLLYVISIFSRLLVGLLMQNKHFPVFGVPAVTAMAGTIIFMSLNFSQSRHLTIFLWGMLGVPAGFIFSSYSVTTLALVGQDLLPNAMGLVTTIVGIGTAIAGVVNGHMRDVTSSYEIPLLVSAGVTSLSLTLFCISGAILGNDKHRNTRKETVDVFYTTKL